MRKASTRHWGLPVALGLAACLTAAAGCGDTDERPVTWSYISASIIQPSCGTSRCHSEGSEAHGWTFDTLDSYDQFVEDCIIVTAADPGRCKDGNGDPFTTAPPPDQQQLIRALTGDNLERMPPDYALPDGDIDLIRRWIAAGAVRD
jgi:hypothetical protein